jgi:hypothetical protein
MKSRQLFSGDESGKASDASRPKADIGDKGKRTPNVELTGAARLYRAASVRTAGLAILDFDMLLEVVEDALPTLLLLLSRILIFCFKRFCNPCSFRGLHELDGYKPVVSELEVQRLLWRNFGEDAFEIKAN